MKIFVLPTSEELQPTSQPFVYPDYNIDFGVEQDFVEYLTNHSELVTQDPNEADWHYLPVFWTRWHLNHDYGKNGLSELSRLADEAIIDKKKTFTICQYDDGPKVKLDGVTKFLSSRRTKIDIDIPLLAVKVKQPYIKPKKGYRASFIGRINTHPVRKRMVDVIGKRKDIFMFDGNMGVKPYITKTLESYVALCPRGYGGSSYRLFEAMQLGVVPFLVGDNDTRPFKKFIDWSKISLYTDRCDDVERILDKYTEAELKEMGREAKRVYNSDLSYKKWCNFAVKELELL